MSYIGDFTRDKTFETKFTTVDGAGQPSTLIGGVISIYKKDFSSESVAGITLYDDWDGLVGLNHITVNLNSDAFYVEGEDYQVVLTAGTVDGVDITGYVVKEFSIENRREEGLIGAPFLLADGVTLATLVDMISEIAENVNKEGTYNRSSHSLQALSTKLDNIGTVGSAINKAADTLDLQTGTIQSGAVLDTRTLNGAYQILNDAAGVLDGRYEFNIGGTGVPVNGNWEGYLQSGNDTVDVLAYDWNLSAFEVVGNILGAPGTSNMSVPFVLFPEHVGTGLNLGDVIIAFQGTGLTSAVLATDQLFISFASINQSTGYEGGKVWVDTVNGTAGTESYVNGTADKPSLTWADAQNIADNLGLRAYNVNSGSAIVLNQATTFVAIEGDGYTVDLNGQNIEGIKIEGSSLISGIALGGAVPPFFKLAGIGAVTIPPTNALNCGVLGPITIGSEGTFIWGECASILPNSNPAILDFGVARNASDFSIHSWGGGALQINNAGKGTGTYTYTMVGMGKLIVDASCESSTLVTTSGNIDRNSNVAGVTYDDDARVTTESIQVVLSDIHGAGSWQSGASGGGNQTFLATGETIVGDTGVNGDYTDTNNVGVSDLILTTVAATLDYELLFNVGADHQGLSATLRMAVNAAGSREIEIQLYDYNLAAFQTAFTLRNSNNILETYQLGGGSNDLIDTNGDIRARFKELSFNNNDFVRIDFMSVTTQTESGTIPTVEEIAIGVDNELSKNHGAASWEGDWITKTSIASILVPDTQFIIEPKLGKDIDINGVVLARFRDSSGNDSFRQVVSYVESSGIMTIDSNPNFTLATGDRIDIAIELGEAVSISLEDISTTLGTPTDTDIATDIVNVQSVVDNTNARVTTIEGNTSNLTIKRNQGFDGFQFPMEDVNGNPVSGLTITATKVIDGSETSMTNIASALADGLYKIDISSDDTNGPVVTWKFKAAGVRNLYITITTEV